MDIKSNVVRKENAHVEINFEIPTELLQESYRKELANVQKEYKMPGFRQGKVPLDLIEKKHRRSIETEAVENILSQAYSQVLHENRLSPFTQPEFSKFDLDLSKPLSVTVSFDTYPTIKLKDYKNLSVAKDFYKVTDEDVDLFIKQTLETYAELVPHNEGIKPDDMAVIDLSGSKDGQEDPELTINSQRFEMKKGLLPDDLFHGLLGMKKDEEKVIAVRYPKDYHSARLAGQKIDFRVKVHEVLEKKIPALDEAFIKDLGTFTTVDEYKADMRRKLEAEAAAKAEEQYERAILDAVASKADFAISDSYVQKRTDEHLQEIQKQIEWRKMTLDQFFEQMKTTETKVRAAFKENLLKDVKRTLVWLEVARQEKISVAQEDFEKLLSEMAKEHQQPVERLREYYSKAERKEQVFNELLYKKTMDFLKGIVTEKRGKQLKFSDLRSHQES
jgi:trigger factor